MTPEVHSQPNAMQGIAQMLFRRAIARVRLESPTLVGGKHSGENHAGDTTHHMSTECKECNSHGTVIRKRSAIVNQTKPILACIHQGHSIGIRQIKGLTISAVGARRQRFNSARRHQLAASTMSMPNSSSNRSMDHFMVAGDTQPSVP